MRLWVLKRRLAGLAVVGTIIALILGFAAWYFWPRASCTDGIKNNAEEDVDCGGSCQNQCIGEIPVEPRLLWKKIFPVRQGLVDVGAMVENRNVKLGAEMFVYRFELYTEGGLFLGKAEGKTYLLPKERAFVFHPNIDIGVQKPARVDFSFEPAAWSRIDTQFFPDIEVVKVVSELDSHPVVRAKIFNRALFEEPALEVAALLKNKDGNVFAASKTVIERIGSKRESEAVFTWPQGAFQAVADPDIEILYRRVLR